MGPLDFSSQAHHRGRWMAWSSSALEMGQPNPHTWRVLASIFVLRHFLQPTAAADRLSWPVVR